MQAAGYPTRYALACVWWSRNLFYWRWSYIFCTVVLHNSHSQKKFNRGKPRGMNSRQPINEEASNDKEYLKFFNIEAVAKLQFCNTTS
jgi:hypothetical protein